MQLDEVITASILYFFLPLWLLAGFGDWLCHRAARISENAGLKESVLHLLMLAELGLPLLAGLFLEINAVVIGLMMVGFIAHEATVLWDLRYASSKRRILPVEQIVHSFQELVPMTLLALVIFLHWEQFVALVTMSSAAEFRFEWKRDPLPPLYLTLVLGAAMVLVIVPFLEEAWRCYRRRLERQTDTRVAHSVR